MPEHNTHAIDIHPESPADWPRLPAALEDDSVFLDAFSWSLLLARVLTEWEDLGEPNDADVVHGLHRANALMREYPMDDGWVRVGYLTKAYTPNTFIETGGVVVRIPALANVRTMSAASHQPVAYPITKLPKPVPFGAAFSEPVRSL